MVFRLSRKLWNPACPVLFLANVNFEGHPRIWMQQRPGTFRYPELPLLGSCLNPKNFFFFWTEAKLPTASTMWKGCCTYFCRQWADGNSAAHIGEEGNLSYDSAL